MDVQDGFILGIYNYCDRWCETCAFTSRCRVFAVCAELEARHDPVLKAVADASLLPQVLSPPPPPWMQESIDEMNKRAAEPTSEEELKAIEPNIPPEHEWIERRAGVYGDRVHGWLEARGFLSIDDPKTRAA